MISVEKEVVVPKNIIYGLIDPRDGCVRYIGQTCNPEKRSPHTAETKEKMRVAHLGQVPKNKGVPCPESVKLKISQTKISQNLKGRPLLSHRRPIKILATNSTVLGIETAAQILGLSKMTLYHKLHGRTKWVDNIPLAEFVKREEGEV